MHFRAEPVQHNLPGVFYWGMRLDFTALFYINLPFCIYYFFIDGLLRENARTIISILLLLLCNIPFLAINFIDLGYFSFNNRRSTIDLLFVAADSFQAMGAFSKDYWYLFILFAVTVFLLVVIVKAIFKKSTIDTNIAWYKRYIPAVSILFIFAFVARGAGGRPIMPSTPLLYFDATWQPLASNSTITFLYSLKHRPTQLEIKKYYTAQALDSFFTIKRQYLHAKPFQRRNVVVVMLESFCREYLDVESVYHADTPFLDSIISQSTWCSNAYANGFTSNQGIVSILGSMPPLLEEPYYKSIYSNNRIRGLGAILKEQGYSTHFFYGAEPDHFGFGKFCKVIGIDNQHTREDFNDERYFDGNWGIYDHRFLPFAGSILEKQKEPFLAVLFNISSHPPFTLPPDVKDRFNKHAQKPYQRSAAYVDYSLRLFFDKIKNTDWFRNTLFVFCADHSLITAIKKPVTITTATRIPIFWFEPANPVHREISKTVQQLDIVPTILDRLSYSEPFMSFGRSVNDTINQPAVCKYAGLQMIDSSFVFRFNPELNEPVCMFDTRKDPALTNNLLNMPEYSTFEKRMLLFGKAFIQRYNNALIQNQLYIK
ncbi:LTA synthase family protein [Niastella populi]|nr:sulfatase-like hydrolase/transferase [Niastella populi]